MGKSRRTNLGGTHLNIIASGADEALERTNLLLEKLNEAKLLIV